jgi:hypothetical protein
LKDKIQPQVLGKEKGELDVIRKDASVNLIKGGENLGYFLKG